MEPSGEVITQVMLECALSFLQARQADIAETIEAALGRASRLIGCDHAAVFEFTPDAGHADATHGWCAPDVTPSRGARYARGEALSLFEAVELGQPVILQGGEPTPLFADVYEMLQAQRNQLLVIIPLLEHGRLRWSVCFDWRKPVQRPDRATAAFCEQFARVVHAGLQRQRELEVQAQIQARSDNRQKLEAVGVMAGGIAHDFNNVLQAHLGLCELLESELPEGPALDLVRLIDSSAQRAGDITRRLLVFSRQESRPHKPVSVLRSLAEVVQLLRHSVRESCEITLSVAPDAGNIRVVPADFDQAIMNLCNNAAAAMPNGGLIEITAARDASTGFVRIAVRDTGKGMTPEELARAGEVFFTTKPVGEGTGLGLAMVQRMAERVGGRFALSSQPGTGTLAQVWLPSASEVEVEAPEEGLAPSARAGETVLVVEDDAIVRRVACSHLQRAGYTVLQAADGRAALALHREHAREIDLILTDAIMPGMGGVALYEAIAAEGPPPPFLFASGYDAGALSHGFLAGEGRNVVEKPYQAASLLRAVRRLIDARRAR